VDEHEKNLCIERTSRCDECSMSVKVKDHWLHRHSCQMARVFCNICLRTMRRKDVKHSCLEFLKEDLKEAKLKSSKLYEKIQVNEVIHDLEIKKLIEEKKELAVKCLDIEKECGKLKEEMKSIKRKAITRRRKEASNKKTKEVSKSRQ